jgi:hypothetical protein
MLGGGVRRNSKFLNITVAGTYSNHWHWDSKEWRLICGRRRTYPTRAASLLHGRLLDYRAGDSLSYILCHAICSAQCVSLKHTVSHSVQGQSQNEHSRRSQQPHMRWTGGGGGREGKGGRVLLIPSANRSKFFFPLLIWTEFRVFGIFFLSPLLYHQSIADYKYI